MTSTPQANASSGVPGSGFPEGRYTQLPEVVPLENYPEVAANSQHVYPEVAYNQHSYPEVLPPPAYLDKGPYPEATSVPLDKSSDNLGGQAVVDQEAARPTTEKPRGFVLTRKWIIALVVGVIVIVVAAVVGGVVASKANSNGAANEKNSSGSGGGAATTSSGTGSGSSTRTSTASTSTATGASSSSSANLVPAAVAAVDTTNGKNPSIQVFYQAAGSTDIKYSTYGGGASFNLTDKLDVSSAPSLKTPMALVSRLDDSSNVLATLFYISSSGDSSSISKMEISCQKSYLTCSTTSTSVITTNATNKVHPQSGLAAVWLGDSGARVYYQSESGSLVELNGASEAKSGWKDGELKASAAAGSRIAATWATGPKISVFYADSQSNLPSELVYDGGWKSAVNVATGSPSSWNVSSSLAACYVPTPDTFRFYYSDTTTGTIVEYLRSGSDTAWTKSGSSTKWSTADSGIAAVGWLDQVRLYYMSGSELQQSLLGNGTWKSTSSI
ncbi:hypothetical protein GQ53DRAFT_755008, partial [Thozetella sp. PMI_491]